MTCIALSMAISSAVWAFQWLAGPIPISGHEMLLGRPVITTAAPTLDSFTDASVKMVFSLCSIFAATTSSACTLSCSIVTSSELARLHGKSGGGLIVPRESNVVISVIFEVSASATGVVCLVAADESELVHHRLNTLCPCCSNLSWFGRMWHSSSRGCGGYRSKGRDDAQQSCSLNCGQHPKVSLSLSGSCHTLDV